MIFKRITVSALLLSVSLLLSSCGHTHSFGKWNDYGSYQARECEECGYTEKEYYGSNHSEKEISGSDSSESSCSDAESSAASSEASSRAADPADSVFLCVKETRHDNQGLVIYYTYDYDGKCVRELYAYASGIVYCDVKYEYDSDGNRVYREGVMSGGTGTVYYYYNDAGLLTEKNSTNGKYRSIHRYEYDANNRLVTDTETYYDYVRDGFDTVIKTTYYRDSDGRITHETETPLHKENPQEVTTYTYTYGADSYTKTGEEYEYVYRLDDKLISEKWLIDLKRYSGPYITQNEYDENGTLIKTRITDNSCGDLSEQYIDYDNMSLSDYRKAGKCRSTAEEAGFGGIGSGGNGSGSGGGEDASGGGPKICAVCNGRGSYQCIGCSGSGQVLSYYDINHNPVYNSCPVCRGMKTVSCKGCNGDGYVQDGH